jgi:hypothetical protein
MADMMTSNKKFMIGSVLKERFIGKKVKKADKLLDQIARDNRVLYRRGFMTERLYNILLDLLVQNLTYDAFMQALGLSPVIVDGRFVDIIQLDQ